MTKPLEGFMHLWEYRFKNTGSLAYIYAKSRGEAKARLDKGTIVRHSWDCMCIGTPNEPMREKVW